MLVSYLCGTIEAFGPMRKYVKDHTTSLNVYNVLKAESKTLCASKCDADNQCEKFAFTQSRQACYTSNATNNAGDIRQVEPDMVVYSKQVKC